LYEVCSIVHVDKSIAFLRRSRYDYLSAKGLNNYYGFILFYLFVMVFDIFSQTLVSLFVITSDELVSFD
jgi:hypothetical protein